MPAGYKTLDPGIRRETTLDEFVNKSRKGIFMHKILVVERIHQAGEKMLAEKARVGLSAAAESSKAFSR